MQLITLPIRNANFYGVGYGVTACADGRTAFALTGYDSGPGVLWRVDLDAGKATGRMDIVTDDEHGTCWPPPVVSPGGRTVAFGDRLKRLGRRGRVELAGTGVPRGFHWSVVDPLAFTADGRRLVGTAGLSGRSSAAGRTPIHLWNVPRRRAPDAPLAPARTLEIPAGDDGSVEAATVRPDGSELAIVTQYHGRTPARLRLQRAALDNGGGWLPAADLPDPLDAPADSHAHAAYSPDGRTLAVGTRAGVHLFRPTAHRPRLTLRTAVAGLAFTPDSARLVTVTARGTASVWAVDDGRRLARYDWKTVAGRLAGVAVLPDGLTAIASGTRGRLVRWDLPG